MSMAVPAPVELEVDAPEQVTNWRPLVQWFLAIPHLVVVYVLQAVSGVLTLVSFFAILFTQKIPPGIVNFQIMYLRYRTRVFAYAGFMHEQYPKFDFTPSAAEPGGDPVRLSVQPPDTLNRWLPLVKWFLAIPHYVALLVLDIAVLLCSVVAWIAILFTGRYPRRLFNFVVGVMRWHNRVVGYAFALTTDRYPPFRLAA
jgi:hypothetical protein